MTTVDRPGTLAEALVALQGQLPEVKKTQTAKVATSKGSYEYSYAGLAAVSAAILPRLSALGLAFVARPTLVGDRFVLACELIHTGGEKLTAEYPLNVPPGSPAQAIGSALTYARRYCVTAMTGLVAEDDDDAQGVAAASATRPAARRAPNRSAPKDTGAENSAPAGRDAPATETDVKRLQIKLREAGYLERQSKLDFCGAGVGRTIGSSKDLTRGEVAQLIGQIEAAMADTHESGGLA